MSDKDQFNHLIGKTFGDLLLLETDGSYDIIIEAYNNIRTRVHLDPANISDSEDGYHDDMCWGDELYIELIGDPIDNINLTNIPKEAVITHAY